MQSVSSRIWTRVALFISNDDNNYTTGTSTIPIVIGALDRVTKDLYMTKGHGKKRTNGDHPKQSQSGPGSDGNEGVVRIP